MKRRKFIALGSLASMPLFTGSMTQAGSIESLSNERSVNFVWDGHFLEPKQYISLLQEIESTSGIQGDFYSAGGVVRELEEKFCEISGKEAAIFMPSGTMANELSIRVLCGNKTKAIVHDQSHIFRDEGDSAQAIHNKRLVPIVNDNHYFSANELSDKIDSLEQGEVFYDGVGALSIENPVRRHFGKIVDIGHIREVTAYARDQGIKTHLDGARIHLASAWSGIPVKEYSSHFDTVYISLYKYLSAAGGAILCGDQGTIGQMSHFVKILGGTTFSSWPKAAIASHFLNGLDQRLQETVEKSGDLLNKLDGLDEVQVKTIDEGSNVAFLHFQDIRLEAFVAEIGARHGIFMRTPKNDELEIHLNESLLTRSNEELFASFKSAIQKSS